METIRAILDHWLTHNSLVVGGFSLIAWILWSASHHERWQRAWIRFRADRTGIVALLVVFIYLGIGALEIIRVPAGPGGPQSILDLMIGNRIPSEKSYSAPMATAALSEATPEPLNARHVLGTDALGKDVLIQTLKGCSTALIIAGLTSAIYIPVGTLLGIFAGYFRRRVDDGIQYVYTTLASIPEILLLIALMTVLGKGLGQMSLALGITSWVGLCRLIRGETMRQS